LHYPKIGVGAKEEPLPHCKGARYQTVLGCHPDEVPEKPVETIGEVGDGGTLYETVWRQTHVHHSYNHWT